VLREHTGRAFGLVHNRIIFRRWLRRILNLWPHTYLSRGRVRRSPPPTASWCSRLRRWATAPPTWSHRNQFNCNVDAILSWFRRAPRLVVACQANNRRGRTCRRRYQAAPAGCRRNMPPGARCRLRRLCVAQRLRTRHRLVRQPRTRDDPHFFEDFTAGRVARIGWSCFGRHIASMRHRFATVQRLDAGLLADGPPPRVPDTAPSQCQSSHRKVANWLTEGVKHSAQGDVRALRTHPDPFPLERANCWLTPYAFLTSAACAARVDNYRLPHALRIPRTEEPNRPCARLGATSVARQ